MGVVARGGGLACLALIAACGAKQPATAFQERVRERAQTPDEIREVVTAVSGARRLSEKRTVVIKQFPRAEFVEHVRDVLDEDDGQNAVSARQEAAWLLAFGLAPGAGTEAEASATEVLEEQIAGFYSRDTDRVSMPFVTIGKDEEMQRAVLAHEVHHALQNQHFDIQALRATENDDQALARLALVEGDAMVAMGAYLGARYGAPIRRTLRRLTDVVEETVSVEDMSGTAGHHDDKLSRALPILRERLMFPYVEGMNFITDVFRVGGFALVDDVYRRPPDTTSEILHPEKYIAGFRAARIGELPKLGLSPIEEGSFGELQLRVMLGMCHTRESAVETATGWNGDRYAVRLSGDGDVVLLWRTEWASELDAGAFADAIDDPDCRRANSMSAGASLSIGDQIAVRQQGKSVAVVRGLRAQEAEQAIVEILRVSVQQPPAHDVEHRVIPPRVPLPEGQTGTIHNDVYQSEWLGLTGRIPSGMTYEVGDDFELHISREGEPIIGRLVLSDRITTDEFNDIAFNAIGQAFGQAIGVGSITQVSSTRWRSPLGDSIERTYRAAGTSVHLRAVLIPICAGTGSLVFVQAFADDYARRVLDGWLSSFRWQRGRNLPVCEALDPK